MTAAHADRLRGIYGIVDRALTGDVIGLLDAWLAARVRVVQYRAKAGVERDVVRALHARTRAAGAFLIVNDDLAAARDADGWHGGQEDLSGRTVAAVRAYLGERIVGVSCGTAGEAAAAERAGADYVGVGPFAATTSKADAGAPLGEPGLRAVVRATRLPVVAIGGITLEALPAVARSGAAMAAVISAVARASDPAAAARALVTAWGALP